MDCEKFESTLLDELYEELDEVTSAAAKRHVSGCSRCASLLSGFKATRRVAVLEMVEPPGDLEDRILAAAKEAQKVVPMNRRVSGAISWAGSWAMRPQTAMAALFLLMIGSSALLLKGKHAAPPSTMTVSDQGEPVTATGDRPVASDTEGAQAIANEPSKTGSANALAAPPPYATPSPTAAPAASEMAKGSDSLLDGLVARGRSASAPAGRLNQAPTPPAEYAPKAYAAADDKDEARNAATVAGAPAPATVAAMKQAAGGGGGGSASGASLGGFAQAPPPPAAPAPQRQQQPNLAGQGPATFDGATAAYNNGDYATAAALFDQLASSGDLNAALWAARSVREGNGCPQAASRFDQVARVGTGTAAGYDAMFEAGRCYKVMQQSERARAWFNVLLGVPRYVDRAKTELASMGPMASAKAQAKPQQQAPAAQQAPASPPPATKATTQAY